MIPENDSGPKRDQEMLEGYDRHMVLPLHAAYYENSDFYNLGYWGDGATSQKQACEHLVDKLVSLLPDTNGSILDVACGLGATTRSLQGHFPPERVTGINLSAFQLEKARENAPGAHFLRMDAAQLAFADETFDNVICVEAAFHFHTRAKFYAEAFRVLKPGGGLVTTDLKGPKWIMKANFLDGTEAFEDALGTAGFSDVRIEEVTDATLGGFCRNLRAWGKQRRKSSDTDTRTKINLRLTEAFYPFAIGVCIKEYYLTAARKPSGEPDSASV